MAKKKTSYALSGEKARRVEREFRTEISNFEPSQTVEIDRPRQLVVRAPFSTGAFNESTKAPGECNTAYVQKRNTLGRLEDVIEDGGRINQPFLNMGYAGLQAGYIVISFDDSLNAYIATVARCS